MPGIMIEPITREHGGFATHAKRLASAIRRDDAETTAYFVSCRDLRSHDPAVRRPAISVLLGLARQANGPTRTRAARIIEAEFGPYVVPCGMLVCAAPLSEVVICDDEGHDCHICPWLWTGAKPATPLPD